MTRAVRNIRAAQEEFAAAVRWYEEQRTGLGAEFFRIKGAWLSLTTKSSLAPFIYRFETA